MCKNNTLKTIICDIFIAILAGIVVGTAYHFFQNSNGFAPGGVGGLATITYHFLQSLKVWSNWSVLMVVFNMPIFVLVSLMINKKLGLMLIIYMLVQSSMPQLYNAIGFHPYSLATSGSDYNVVLLVLLQVLFPDLDSR